MATGNCVPSISSVRPPLLPRRRDCVTPNHLPRTVNTVNTSIYTYIENSFRRAAPRARRLTICFVHGRRSNRPGANTVNASFGRITQRVVEGFANHQDKFARLFPFRHLIRGNRCASGFRDLIPLSKVVGRFDGGPPVRYVTVVNAFPKNERLGTGVTS